MTESERQLEQAKQAYLSKRYPGDLADMIHQSAFEEATVTKARSKGRPRDATRGLGFWSSVAAALAIGVTITILLALPQQRSNVTQLESTGVELKKAAKAKQLARKLLARKLLARKLLVTNSKLPKIGFTAKTPRNRKRAVDTGRRPLLKFSYPKSSPRNSMTSLSWPAKRGSKRSKRIPDSNPRSSKRSS